MRYLSLIRFSKGTMFNRRRSPTKQTNVVLHSSSSASRDRSTNHKSFNRFLEFTLQVIALAILISSTFVRLLHLGRGTYFDNDYNDAKMNAAVPGVEQQQQQEPPIKNIPACNLNCVLQQRYDALPTPPPWPQLDHRISKAIVDGYIIGCDPNTPPQQCHTQNNTIVTAYYQFESKHGVGQYGSWFSRLLRAAEPMVIFVEPGSKWVEYVKTRRRHAPTVIATMKFDELVMSTSFTKEYWDFMHTIDLEAKVHKSSAVYKIWNEKLIFMYAAIYMNPFRTGGFAWMDAGYFRNDNDAPKEVGDSLIKVNITERGVPKEKVLVLHVRNDDLSAPGRVNVAGNSFVGTASAFLDFYLLYYQTFWHWSSIKKFIGSDQFVMTEACRRYPTNCHPFYPGRYKHWFAMSEAMKGEADIAKVSEHYLFLEEPPNDIPGVPTGEEIISYCGGEVKPASKCVDI